jgi:type 1 glutamine amidotransferase
MKRHFIALLLLLGSTFGLLVGAAPEAPSDRPEKLAILVMLKKKTHPFVKYLEDNYRVKFHFALPEGGAGIPGVKAVEECDVILLSQRRQDTTPEQTDLLKKALLKDHKGIVGIRQASHAFNRWPEIDREVFGATYRGHFFEGKDRQFVQIEEKAKDNPLVAGFKPFVCNDYLYGYTNIAPDVEVLMSGGLPGKIQPVTWARVTREGLRAFYTRYDERDLETSEDCRRMVSRALFWAAGKEPEKYRNK